jgi:hypothetical protein
MLTGLIDQGFNPANWPSRCQSWHGNVCSGRSVYPKLRYQ